MSEEPQILTSEEAINDPNLSFAQKEKVRSIQISQLRMNHAGLKFDLGKAIDSQRTFIETELGDVYDIIREIQVDLENHHRKIAELEQIIQNQGDELRTLRGCVFGSYNPRPIRTVRYRVRLSPISVVGYETDSELD